MSTTRNCDKCGSVIPSDHGRFEIWGERIIARDLCMDCAVQVFAVIEGKEVSVVRAALK